MSLGMVDASTIDRYRSRSPQSRLLHERALQVLPAGATRSLNAWPPYPLYLKRGQGPLVWDVDGHAYVDFLNNYTALMLGHAHPAVVEAIQERVSLGTSYSFSTELEVELAELLVARIPSIDRVRFMGSGTEAAMFGIRVARAFTGHSRIAKMEGGFHGTYDDVQVSVRPAMLQAGLLDHPNPLPETEGLRQRLTEDVVILPFNHQEETRRLLDQYGEDLAAVIAEPVLGVGGMIPATQAYLQLLRERCDRYGIVLIFDEVITLRLAPGGAQELFGVVPDLTVMGKLVGGGMPIGALGGRAALMSLLEPGGGFDVYDPRSGGARVYQGGTFTGNPLSMAAGLATLKLLQPSEYSRLNRLGDDFRLRVSQVFQLLEVDLAVTGYGSLFNLHATAPPVDTFRAARRSDSYRQHELFLALLNEGIVVAPRGMGCLSTPMGEEHLERFERAIAKVIESTRTDWAINR